MAELCYETINRSPFLTPGFEADLPAQMRAAGKAGFRWTGLDLPSIRQYLERGGSLRDLRSLLEDVGLRCLELQPLILSEDVEATRDEAHAFAEVAAFLDVPWVQGGVVAEPSPALMDSFRVAASTLAEAGAAIALEYLPFNALCSIADTRRFLARSGVESARIVVDTWHFFHGPDEWMDLETLAVEELAYPQFNDAPPLESEDLMYETTQRRVLPGAGRFDLERFSRLILDKGYEGPVSIEILSASLRQETPERFARAAYEASAPYWSR